MCLPSVNCHIHNMKEIVASSNIAYGLVSPIFLPIDEKYNGRRGADHSLPCSLLQTIFLSHHVKKNFLSSQSGMGGTWSHVLPNFCLLHVAYAFSRLVRFVLISGVDIKPLKIYKTYTFITL